MNLVTLICWGYYLIFDIGVSISLCLLTCMEEVNVSGCFLSFVISDLVNLVEDDWFVCQVPQGDDDVKTPVFRWAETFSFDACCAQWEQQCSQLFVVPGS